MVIKQTDPETGEVYPSFGIENDPEGRYKKFKTTDTERDALYLIKANVQLNTIAYTYLQSQILSGKIKFLIDENQAKAKLMGTKVGQTMTPDRRSEYLIPFTRTSMLREELLNLVQENEGVNIILKRATRATPKDKFSALIYGMYYIKLQEDSRDRKRKRDVSKLMLFG